MSVKHNDAEQIRVTRITAAGANTKMSLVSKSVSFTLADGSSDFKLGDTFTLAITKNPPAAGAVTAASTNQGNGSPGSVTLVGDWPEETITFRCKAEAGNGGTFSAYGSKTGNLTDLTVGQVWTHVLEKITVGDQVLAVMALSANGADVTWVDISKITVEDGGIKCSDNLTTSGAGGVIVFWRKRNAG